MKNATWGGLIFDGKNKLEHGGMIFLKFELNMDIEFFA